MDDQVRHAPPGGPVRPVVPPGGSSGRESGFDFTALVATEKRRTRRRAAGIAVIAVVVVAVGATVAFWLGLGAPSGSDVYYDADARAGQAPWKSQEEVQAELDRVVEEGMFDIAIAATVEFPAAGEEGLALIENAPGNRYDMRVSIALDGTGEEVYRSGLIAPGSYVQSIALARDLAAGSYKATATFEAINAETHEPVGKAAAKVELVVKGG